MQTVEPDTSHQALIELRQRLGADRVRVSQPLAPFTTYRIGGPADLFYQAKTTGELAKAIELANELGVPYFLLGLGANILVGDGGIRGLVIKNESRRVDFLGAHVAAAESGAVMSHLIEATEERGLSGLEHFAGIPSTVGGALWQNLHFLAPDRVTTVFIEECLRGAQVLTEAGDIVEVDKDYFQFGYDASILHHRRDVVLKATFELTPRSKEAVRDVIGANLKWRAEKHPDLTQFPSAGSVFRKIEGLGAGRLIDQCGLKGTVVGRAQIAEKHANFIVNLGGATADDVLQLIRLCQYKVRERFSVELTPEISLVGAFHAVTEQS
ncbi:MAG: UDP-N-acetylmuramate dehydrogenase [Chloroflexi bacterium]|nr:UDP-N-acetylmuramate dehydrogenase [Chloroflexota bacterium]